MISVFEDMSKKYLVISILNLPFSMIIPITFMIAYAENATVMANSQIKMSANSLYNNLTMILGKTSKILL